MNKEGAHQVTSCSKFERVQNKGWEKVRGLSDWSTGKTCGQTPPEITRMLGILIASAKSHMLHRQSEFT
jgi:hypothetical protein